MHIAACQSTFDLGFICESTGGGGWLTSNSFCVTRNIIIMLSFVFYESEACKFVLLDIIIAVSYT